MPEFTVKLAALATIYGSLEVDATSEAEAIAEAVRRCQEARWPVDEDGGSLYASPGRAYVAHVQNLDTDKERSPKVGAGLEPHVASQIGDSLLREARDLFKHAGAMRTVGRIRLAITSAGGAIRHAQGKAVRS